MQNYLVKVTKDDNGTAVASVHNRTIMEAATDSIVSLVKPDQASVGVVSTAVISGVLYLTMVVMKQRHTGQFSWNPL